MPEVATQIRRGAVLCRHQVNESTTMLRKVEQTAAAVINLFPDLGIRYIFCGLKSIVSL